jgi:hypothetical protein
MQVCDVSKVPKFLLPLVRSDDFRWLPGMKLINGDGRVMDVLPGIVVLDRSDGRGGFQTFDPTTSFALPDPKDPATFGCLLHLAAKTLGVDRVSVDNTPTCDQHGAVRFGQDWLVKVVGWGKDGRMVSEQWVNCKLTPDYLPFWAQAVVQVIIDGPVLVDMVTGEKWRTER